MTCVIIGGPHDGQRVRLTAPTEVMELACFNDIHTVYEYADSIGFELTRLERYIYTELSTRTFRYTFYRYHKLTVDQAIGALINGYHNAPTG